MSIQFSVHSMSSGWHVDIKEIHGSNQLPNGCRSGHSDE